MFGSAVDRSNCDNDGIEWVIFTAGYGLQRVNYFRRENDRIFRFVRISAVAAYTTVWNLTGQPAASVPAGFSRDGRPLAVQLVGRPNDEATLLSLAAQIEAERAWPERRPALDG